MATISVGDITPKNQYTATAGQTVFAYTFPIFADADIKVYIGSTLKTLSADYTVSGAETDNGGNVTLGTGASVGDIVTIYRDMAISRTSDYQANGDLLAETLNDDLDKLVMMTQQVEDQVNNNTLTVDQFDTSVDLTLPVVNTRKGTVLGFNATTGAPEAGPTIANVNSLAAITANINTVAGIHANVTAVANDATDIGVVAGKATEIGRLGTTDAVADMALLGTSDVVSDMNTLATSANMTSMGLLGNSTTQLNMAALGNAQVIEDMELLSATAVLADMALLGTTDVIADMAALGTSTVIGYMQTNAGNTANINSLAIRATYISALGPVATEIGRLGTSAAVADLAILGTSDIVADMAILGTTDVVADMAILATSDIVADMAILATADIVNDMNVLGTSANVTAMNTLGTSANVTAMSNVSGSIANVNTVATNLTSVNNFGEQYKVASSAPSSPSEGDLWFDTANNIMKVYDASAWVAAYASLSGALPLSGGTMTGDLILGQNIKLEVGATSGGDLQIYHDGSHSRIKDAGTGSLFINATDLKLKNADSSKSYIQMTDGGDVKLYYDNSEKLATTNTGVDITGDVIASGNIIKGHSSSIGQEVCQSGTTVSAWTPDVQINRSGNGGLAVSQFNTGNTASANIWLTKSSNATVGTHASLAEDEAIGRIIFSASDGSTFSNGASIEAFADDGQGTNDTPARLEFKTTADGATTPTTRMIINSAGDVGIGTSPSGQLHLKQTSGDQFLKMEGATTNWGWRNQADGTYGLFDFTNSRWVMLGNSSSAWRFEINGSEKARFTADGLTFNGDTASANALDDYEEGTWTPTLANGTIGAASGVYTKIGNTVHATCTLKDFSDKSTNASIIIRSLPFAQKNTGINAGPVVSYQPGQSNPLNLITGANVNEFMLFYMYNASSWGTQKHNTLGSDPHFYCKFSYQAA